ncbi:MAG: hypothetical protein SGJ00_05320 [bacterium]|nr:hypothetical protein [bacterium]
MKKTGLFLFLLLLIGGKINAQKQEDSLPSRHLGISANAGITGIGGSLNIKLTKKIELTLGYSLMSATGKLETTFDGQKVDLTILNKNNYASFIFNLYPSVNSSFHFLAGVLQSNNKYSIQAISTDSQEYGNMIFAPDQMGKLEFNIKGAEWMPMAGIGFGRSIPKRRIGFGLDLGAAYWGKLNASISADKAFEPTNSEHNVEVIQKAFSDYNWLPFVNFRLNIKLF